MRAASISTINPRQLILGSYSEPKKVNDEMFFFVWHATHSHAFLRELLRLDSPQIELREDPIVAASGAQRVQHDDDHRLGVQRVCAAAAGDGVPAVAVSVFAFCSLSISLYPDPRFRSRPPTRPPATVSGFVSARIVIF